MGRYAAEEIKSQPRNSTFHARTLSFSPPRPRIEINWIFRVDKKKKRNVSKWRITQLDLRTVMADSACSTQWTRTKPQAWKKAGRCERILIRGSTGPFGFSQRATTRVEDACGLFARPLYREHRRRRTGFTSPSQEGRLGTDASGFRRRLSRDTYIKLKARGIVCSLFSFALSLSFSFSRQLPPVIQYRGIRYNSLRERYTRKMKQTYITSDLTRFLYFGRVTIFRARPPLHFNFPPWYFLSAKSVKCQGLFPRAMRFFEWCFLHIFQIFCDMKRDTHERVWSIMVEFIIDSTKCILKNMMDANNYFRKKRE